MSYSGHNITSSSGAYLPPSIDETDRTAYNANLQINLNIRPGVDTVDTAQHTKVPKEIWKYQSQASRPLLPPVHTLRARTPGEEPRINEGWKSKFDDLLKSLPEDIREFFIQQQALPNDLRLPSMMVMENVFVVVAKFLVWIEQAASPEGKGTIQEMQRNLNLIMPKIARKGLEESGSASVKYIRDMLDQMGRSNPNYEHISQNLEKAEEGLSRLFPSDKSTSES